MISIGNLLGEQNSIRARVASRVACVVELFVGAMWRYARRLPFNLNPNKSIARCSLSSATSGQSFSTMIPRSPSWSPKFCPWLPFSKSSTALRVWRTASFELEASRAPALSSILGLFAFTGFRVLLPISYLAPWQRVLLVWHPTGSVPRVLGESRSPRTLGGSYTVTHLRERRWLVACSPDRLAARGLQGPGPF